MTKEAMTSLEIIDKIKELVTNPKWNIFSMGIYGDGTLYTSFNANFNGMSSTNMHIGFRGNYDLYLTFYGYGYTLCNIVVRWCDYNTHQFQMMYADTDKEWTVFLKELMLGVVEPYCDVSVPMLVYDVIDDLIDKNKESK